MDNSFDNMTRKEKRFARIVALKAIYAYEVSQIKVEDAIGIVCTAIENDYEELDKLIEYYKLDENNLYSEDLQGCKTREQEIDLLNKNSAAFSEKYQDWYDWSIVNKLDVMPSSIVIAYSGRLARLAIKNIETSDELIVNRLKNWEMKRVSLMDKLILRLEISEMLHEEGVPPKVSIVEGVEIAKLFSSDDSGRFVNGILDSIYNDSLKGLIKSSNN